MDFKKLMAEANKVQNTLKKRQAEFDEQSFEYDYKSLVKIVIKGTLEITEIIIQNDIVDHDDIDTLQDVIKAAVNNAVLDVNKKKNDLINSIMPSQGGLF
ncbi:YbaB/EbfC family nucleoid-associated protein [Ureaplasma canigenitalium]|uniref:YbaB/EbfC family nucleoid-associated protein n=1 Tax=Ureaplasma canigenitalium TaxID=42092 RepID=UPI0004E2495E|nr:YbaB/EbfC family nucleoid-associated protein [Ureaplasma canigenitalium]